MKGLIEIDGLTKRYGRTIALGNISMEVGEGEIVGILGPNGSGKSTLLKVIAGLVRPSSGRVTVFGMKPGHGVRKLLAYMSENDYLYRWMTVKELVEWTSKFHDNWSMDKTQALLEFFDIDWGLKVANLSRGMRGRLKVALAFSREVPLYLLDEPLSGIDAASRSKILDILIREYRPENSTILLSTHLVMEAESLFDRAIFLKNGEKIIDEAAENLRDRYGASINNIFIQIYG